MVLGVSQ